MKKITLGNIFKGLPMLTGLLIILNLVAFAFTDLHTARYVRLISLMVFVVFYIYKTQFKKGIILYILGVFVLREVTLLFYETEVGHALYLVLGIIVYGIISFERKDVIKNLVFNLNSLLITIILVLANIYTLYELSGMIQENYIGPFEPVLFYFYGGFMILLGATAIIYNQIYNSNRSLMYVFFALCILTSDVTSLFAYYFNVEFLFYMERSAFLLSFGFFLYTALETNQELQEIEQYEMISSSK
ncbi:hypothetical protein [Dokdonia sp. Hel_I_53]|uniref:hypothetical protein n=1 Tax=Dokdonia sp. Hel_I_53 TaxID=1566287 RepID=UPI00119B1888|nr:hypothetical protein [Dokdonia sp. Hel_I_53]TVZ51725.1 hypothetical protein OD90_0877 [Dokdonia sp. Hel_I_53]